MGKKDRKPKTKEFQNNPFRDLKGLSVSAKDEPPPAQQAKKPPAEPSPRQGGDLAELFAQEMAVLGVQRLAGGQNPEDEQAPAAESAPPEVSATASAEKPPPEKDEFLAALGQLDVTFSDEFPEDGTEALPQAAPRRMRQLRQGRLVPEQQLDLHGLHRDRALEKVGWFLEDCVFQGLRTVLIITGRGRNSAEGPVLREAVARYLRGDGAAFVLEWGTAPPRYGGEGALVVFLRRGEAGEKT